MNDLQLQRIIKEKAGDDGKVVCRYVPKFPVSAEREYIRMTGALMKLVKDELKQGLPEIKKQYVAEYKKSINTDSIFDGFDWLLVGLFNKMLNRLTEKVTKFGLLERLLGLSVLVRKSAADEWSTAVHHALGIDIRKEYYRGEWYKQGLIDWTKQNAELIQTIPQQSLNEVKEVIREGFVNGQRPEKMAKKIQQRISVNENRAKFIARDQVAKLNAEITKQNQEDAGCTEYVWDDSGDERVRASHHALSGTRQRWDTPPETEGGRHCHPGEDFQCRCVALPVFDLNVKLPWETEKGEA